MAAGDIEIDGLPIKQLNAKAIAKKISYVSQEPYVISGTIRENLLLGQKKEVSDETCLSALKRWVWSKNCQG